MLMVKDHAKPKSDRPWAEVRAENKRIAGVRWYAVHCAGAPDSHVEHCAKEIGWETYLPKVRELKPKPKRELTLYQRQSGVAVMRAVDALLFPRYPFLRFDLADPRRSEMFQLFGVQGILCIGDGFKPEPAPIPDETIAELRAKEIDGVIPNKATLKALFYEIGERVRIKDGPFTAHDAVVDELPAIDIDKLDPKHRLKLLVSLFGRETIVELPLGSVEKL